MNPTPFREKESFYPYHLSHLFSLRHATGPVHGPGSGVSSVVKQVGVGKKKEIRDKKLPAVPARPHL